MTVKPTARVFAHHNAVDHALINARQAAVAIAPAHARDSHMLHHTVISVIIATTAMTIHSTAIRIATLEHSQAMQIIRYSVIYIVKDSDRMQTTVFFQMRITIRKDSFHAFSGYS